MAPSVMCEPWLPEMMVYPSAADRATRVMPIAPPAPVTSSITTDWPSVPCICSARMRHKVSSGPPAEKGTMIVTGLVGKTCAFASPGQAIAGMVAIRSKERRRIVASSSSGLCCATQRA